jgi:tetratricopeptide (TPR) repeat protein
VELFDRRSDWVPLEDAIVRENTRNLRARLAKYYREDGAEDAIIIALPRGFRAEFSYNPSAPVAAKCRQIAEAFYNAIPGDPSFFRAQMRLLVHASPSYAPAHAHLAEMLLVETVCGDRRFTDQIAWAEKEVAVALALNNVLWLAHVINGALQACRYRWAKAEEAFQTALRIDPMQTRASFWYMAFLMAMNRPDEAFECLEQRRKMTSFGLDSKVWMIEAAFLYVTGRFDEAFHVVLEHLATFSHINDWESYRAGLLPAECKNWLVDVLMACILLKRGPYHTSAVYAMAAERRGAPKFVKGLVCFCLNSSDLPLPGTSADDARNYAHIIEKSPHLYGPLARALWLYAASQFDHCLEQLKEACKEGNPITAWLHILPLFAGMLVWEEYREFIGSIRPQI